MEYLEQQASLGLLEREDTPDPRDLMETRYYLEMLSCYKSVRCHIVASFMNVCITFDSSLRLSFCRVPLETRVCQDLLELLVTKVMLGLLEQMEPMDHQDLQ